MIFLEKPVISKKDYFLIKSVVDKKRNHKIGSRFQSYNNELIDSFVENPDKELNYNTVYPVLYYMTSAFVSNDYKNILRNNGISNSLDTKILLDHERKNHISKVTGTVWERIEKNVITVKDIMNTQLIDRVKYDILKQDNPANFSRMDLLNQAAENGINTDLLNQSMNYRNLDNMAENLARQSQMVTDYEEALLLNANAEANGLDPPITSKRWIWSELDNTRHSNMDGDTVPLENTFEVLNEETGHVDNMLYPCDPEGSDGNVINCQCDAEYFGE